MWKDNCLCIDNNVFIIGNGFDLDLGWRTSYKDFAYSKYWNFIKYNTSNLFHYLNDRKNTNSWFDIEHHLGLYGKEYYKSNIRIHDYSSYAARDRETYEMLNIT